MHMPCVVIVRNKIKREKRKKEGEERRGKKEGEGCQNPYTKSKECVNNSEEHFTGNQGDSKDRNSAALSPSRK